MSKKVTFSTVKWPKCKNYHDVNIKISVVPDTDYAGYPAAGYPANNFAGYPALPDTGYPAE